MEHEPFTVKERLTYAAIAGVLVVVVASMVFGYDIPIVLSAIGAFVSGLLLPSPVKMENK